MSTEITTGAYKPNCLTPDGWRSMQQVEREAFQFALPGRTQEEIDYFVRWDQAERFAETHIQPNVTVGNEFRGNQIYSRPFVSLALDAGQPQPIVGVLYTANNVSGPNALARLAKSAFPAKRYVWMREIAVLPRYQHSGIAHKLAKTALQEYRADQPVSAYVFDENEVVLDGLLSVGFRDTGSETVYPFGPHTRSTEQIRLQIDRVDELLDNLDNI